MHDTIVILKDGTHIEGPIWEFKPTEGYLTIPSAYDGRIYLRDCESIVTLGERISASQVGVDADMLQIAREKGWDGS